MRFLVFVVLVGCGDNLAVCVDVEPPQFTDGPYSDPYELELTGCVEGGLGEITGRWFLRDAEQFVYSYPLYETTCGGGVRLAGLEDYENVLVNGNAFTFQQWWDGTRAVERTFIHYDSADFGYTSVKAVCMRADGTLAGRWVEFDDDFGARTGPLVGTRFDRKDELASGLELVAEVSTSSAGGPIAGYNVVVDEGIAYVVGETGLEIIEVSSGARAVGHVDGFLNDVRVVRTDTQVVAYGAGFDTYIHDVTDPAAPVAAGIVQASSAFGNSHSLQLSNNRLYVADFSDAVPIYDLADPLRPVLIGAAKVPDRSEGIHDLTVDGDRLFVNQTSAGFVALDLSAGVDQPSVLGRTPGPYSHASAVGNAGGRRLALHGDEGMTPEGGAYLRVLDGDPASPDFMTDLGRYQSRPEVGIHNIELVGDRAYIAYYQDGVRVVDLSDPTQPREVAHYNTWDPETASGGPFSGALGIRVVDGLIYVADSERGLLIFREN